MTPMAKRRRARRLPALPRLLLNLGLGALVAASLFGFWRLTLLTLYKQKHFAPGAEHPWDWYADACLALALVALAVLVLNRDEPRPAPTRRVASARAWQNARARGRGPSKRAGRSGYNSLK